jgi:hypothetical protein
MSRSPTARELVEYGLSSVAEERSVQVPLRDLLFINQVLGEFVRFFHQPLHFLEVAQVKAFLGGQGDGEAFEVLAEAYYSKLQNMLPPDIQALTTDGAFDHPSPPAYYKRGA